MHERGKAVEGGLIECQTCEKKIYVVKKFLGKIFQKFFSLNLILSYSLNYFYHFQPFLYYKKCVRFKEVIRRYFDQCDVVTEPTVYKSKILCTKILFPRKKKNPFDELSLFTTFYNPSDNGVSESIISTMFDQ